MSKWEMVKWAEVVEIKNGKSQKAVADVNGRYPIYGSGGVMGYANDYLCDEDTVVIGRKGNINKPIYVAEKFWNVDTAFGLNAKKDRLHPKYLFYFCVNFDFEKLNTTVTIPSLTKSNLHNIEMPLPPYEIQKQIAKTLDTTAELLAMRKQQLAELDKLIKSTFYDMFGDPVINEKGWELKQIGEFSMVKIGPFGSLLHVEDYIEDGFPLVNPSHIVGNKIVPDMKLTLSLGKFNELKSYIMEKGDIVIGRRGEIGRCAVVENEGFLCGTGSMFIRIENDYLPIVLQQLISSDPIRAILEHQSVGVTMKNLNAGTISNLEVPMIPLPLQIQFAVIFTKIEEQKSLIKKAIVEIQYLFDSLSAEYFE